LLDSKPEKHSEPDTFVYDPRNPVPTAGGAVCCNPAIFPWGPKDQRSVEKRKDVLVYSSAPLVADTEVTGPIKLVLHAASSAMDTDFTAKLVDVFPDGSARNLTDGILRVRYR
jgi:putative CocE/NonD family hydrolase